MLIVILQLLFLFIRKLRVLDVIFHTFNCCLLELIKIKSSLLYIIQYFKFRSADTSFEFKP